LSGASEQAKKLLKEHRKELDALAMALLEKENLNEDEILEVTGLPHAPKLISRKLNPEKKFSIQLKSGLGIFKEWKYSLGNKWYFFNSI
jgi:hypothetical protein